MRALLLKCAAFGAGFALTISAVIGLIIYFVSLPKPQAPWNQNAVIASFTEISVNTGEHPIINFSYTINNTTDDDYNIPNEKENLFIELPDGEALYQYKNSLDPFLQDASIDPSFIPAKQHAIVTLHLIYSYNQSYTKAGSENTEQMAKYIVKRLERVGGFKLFDKAKRYQINFPNGWKKTYNDIEKTK